MRTLWLVAKHEVRTTLRQRSFWLFTFLMPALLLGVQVYYVIQDNGLAQSGDSATGKEEEKSTVASADVLTVGLVDEAGLVQEIPSSIPSGMFVRYPDEVAARAALEADEIEQYVHIPADYLVTGDVTVYDKNFLIREGGEEMGVAFQSVNEWILSTLIDTNLTGDENLVAILRNPVPGRLAARHVVNPVIENETSDEGAAQVVASAMPYVYYFILIVVSGYLMRSVVAEKENRTVEVLLVSINPRELMVGKIFGLSIVAWIQLLVWLAAGALVLNRGSSWLNISDLNLAPSFFVWAILFLLFGYLLYASVMAAAGAMAPNAREAGKVTYLLIVPLMPTLMFGSVFFEEPHGTMALALSLFPLSAPSAMVTRLAVADVPLWQPIVSLLGLAALSYLMVVLAARFFRASNLLSDATFTFQRFATGWRE